MNKKLVSDLLAGLTVSFAALSLGAAFGVMSGRGAFSGMLGAAIIPIITSLFGGTRIQASGPTAPMTAVTALLVARAYDDFQGDKHLADEYITLVLLLASLFIVILGLLKLGKYIQLVPQVVVLGFMNGIGVLIWFDQLSKLLGLNGQKPLGGSAPINLTITLATLGLIYLIPYTLKRFGVSKKMTRFIPSVFVTIIIVTLITSSFHIEVQHVSLGEGYNSFKEYAHIIAEDLPLDREIFSYDLIMEALPFALQLCLLAYLDSLLTSLVIDKMTGEKTAANKELVAQGLANGFSGLLQGIPGAQATIRSVLLIKEGAQTRMAGVFVGIFTLMGFLIFGKLIALITSAVFVGILLKAGLDVLDRDFPICYLKKKWYRTKRRNLQMLFVVYTTLITVLIDLNVAVLSGTAFYFLAKKYLGFTDVESSFSEIHSDDLLGIKTETKSS